MRIGAADDRVQSFMEMMESVEPFEQLVSWGRTATYDGSSRPIEYDRSGAKALLRQASRPCPFGRIYCLDGQVTFAQD